MKVYGHILPDADAFCSAAMYYYVAADLPELEHLARVAVDTNKVARLRWFQFDPSKGLLESVITTDVTAEGKPFDLVVDHHEVEGADLLGERTVRDPLARSASQMVWHLSVVPRLHLLSNLKLVEVLAGYAMLGYLGDNATASLEDAVAVLHPHLGEGELLSATLHSFSEAYGLHQRKLEARRTASAAAVEAALLEGEMLYDRSGHRVWLFVSQPGDLTAPPATTLDECLSPGKLYPAAIAAPVYASQKVEADTVIVSDPTGVSTFKGERALEFATTFGGGGHATSAGGKGFTRAAFAEAFPDYAHGL